MALSFACHPGFSARHISPSFRSANHTRRRHRTTATPHACSAVTSHTARLRLEISTVAGQDRGIFGLEEEQRDALEKLIEAVESENPTPVPTADNAQAVSGSWRLLYTNLEILGRKRVRLAIGSSKKSGFVKLGDFIQVVDPSCRQSKNVVNFSAVAAGTGTFTITADYNVVDDKRVSVSTTGTALEPEAFDRLLGENKSLLLQIFDPSGFLDITFVDEALRIGRDNKGHVFVLERHQKAD